MNQDKWYDESAANIHVSVCFTASKKPSKYSIQLTLILLALCLSGWFLREKYLSAVK